MAPSIWNEEISSDDVGEIKKMCHQSRLGSSTKNPMGDEATQQKEGEEGQRAWYSHCWTWLVGIDDFSEFLAENGTQ